MRDVINEDELNQVLDTSFESDRTAYLFIFNICMMILGLFVIFGIVIITAVVWYAKDEIQILHEAEEIDSSIFKQELNELLVLMPFILAVGIMALNLFVIVKESHSEVWFYVHKGRKGFKFISCVLVFAIANLLLLTVVFSTQEESIFHEGVEIEHLIANFVSFLQIWSM